MLGHVKLILFFLQVSLLLPVTNVLHKPMARAFSVFITLVDWYTAKCRLWPKQLSHCQPSFRTAATIFALLSVAIQASFLSSRDPSWILVPICAEIVYGQAHVWHHGYTWPHICCHREMINVLQVPYLPSFTVRYTSGIAVWEKYFRSGRTAYQKPVARLWTLLCQHNQIVIN